MKIVIIVLIVVALIFIAFVLTGALRKDPPPPTSSQMKDNAKKTKPPAWTETIKNALSSMKPKLKLKRETYTAADDEGEDIGPDNKQPFRTVKFHVLGGSAVITYDDITQRDPSQRLKGMENPQECKLPQDPDPDVKDPTRCSIVVMKLGGKLKFACTNNTSCRVSVE